MGYRYYARRLGGSKPPTRLAISGRDDLGSHEMALLCMETSTVMVSHIRQTPFLIYVRT